MKINKCVLVRDLSKFHILKDASNSNTVTVNFCSILHDLWINRFPWCFLILKERNESLRSFGLVQLLHLIICLSWHKVLRLLWLQLDLAVVSLDKWLSTNHQHLLLLSLLLSLWGIQELRHLWSLLRDYLLLSIQTLS